MLESESVGSSICGTDDTQQNNNVIKNAEKENNYEKNHEILPINSFLVFLPFILRLKRSLAN